MALLIRFRYIITLSFFLLCSYGLSSDYKSFTDKYFSSRKLDTLEGIWIKTYANQGPTGCVTLFFKTDKKLYHQIHVDSCFVMNKVTGRQVKQDNKSYNGENAVYYYDGRVDWGESKIKLSEKFDSFEITHISSTNTFSEKWKRIWPENFMDHNNSINQN